MKRRSQTRRVLKWAGTITLITLAGIWLFSGWYEILFLPSAEWKQKWFGGAAIPNNIENARIIAGDFRVWWVPRAMRDQAAAEYAKRSDKLGELPSILIHRYGHPPTFTWPPLIDSYTSSGGTQRQLSIPLWIPFMLITIPTAFLWWLDRRRIPAGHCQHCGYDLTGNVSGRCPECGTPIEREGRPA
jgi:hypothetical protein